MMSASFKTIAWGLLLVVVHINIQGIDMLPDWIGFLLILRGSYVLHKGTGINNFKLISTFAVCLLVFYLLQRLAIDSTSAASVIPSISFSYFLQAIYSLLIMLMIYFICSAIFTYATQRQQNTIADKAKKKGYYYLVINTLLLMLTPLLSLYAVNDASFSLILIALTVANFVILLLIIILLFQTAKLPSAPHIEQPNTL